MVDQARVKMLHKHMATLALYTATAIGAYITPEIIQIARFLTDV